MAAGILDQLLHEGGLADWRVESAGTWTVPQQPLPEDVIENAFPRIKELVESRARSGL